MTERSDAIANLKEAHDYIDEMRDVLAYADSGDVQNHLCGCLVSLEVRLRRALGALGIDQTREFHDLDADDEPEANANG